MVTLRNISFVGALLISGSSLAAPYHAAGDWTFSLSPTPAMIAFAAAAPAPLSVTLIADASTTGDGGLKLVPIDLETDDTLIETADVALGWEPAPVSGVSALTRPRLVASPTEFERAYGLASPNHGAFYNVDGVY